MIILHSTGCPKCNILTKKLEDKKIEYTVNHDIEVMKNLGIMSVPVLEISDGNTNKLLSFVEAVNYLNSIKE